MSRPTIAITAPVRRTERAIPEVVLEAGYLKALDLLAADYLPVTALDSVELACEKLERVDGVILSGGQDLDPRRYDEEPAGAREISLERDALEFSLLDRALELDLPVLAICRGMQLLNVARAGSLYQDLRSQWKGEVDIDHDRPLDVDRPIHEIHVSDPGYLEGVFVEEVFAPNSSHHQGVKELGHGLIPVCRASDGLVEAVELHNGRGNGWVAGVQWHPERMIDEGSGTHRRLFRVFGRAVAES